MDVSTPTAEKPLPVGSPAGTALSSDHHELELPPRPDIPLALKRYTQRWLGETADTPEYKDACRQYEDDLRILHPGEEERKKKSPKTKRNRRDDRDVQVARVYRSAQQTLAMVCPYDHSVRWNEREMVAPPDRMFHQQPKDVWLRQFASTLTNIVQRYTDEIRLPRVLRSWVFQAIQFRCGIMKIGFSRDFYQDAYTPSRPDDEQEAMCRLHYLGEKLLRGEIDEDSAQAEEIKSLVTGLMAGGIVEVWQGCTANTIPLNRFRVDGRVRAYDELHTARWMGEDFLMTKSEILSRWKFTPKPDGTWEGIHPLDFNSASVATYNTKGEKLVQGSDELKRRESRRYADPHDRDEDDGTMYLVREVHARLENKMFWLMEGLDYPLGEVRPTRRSRRWFPYHILGLNPREGTWYSLSDTELAGPIQSRTNRKQSDAEKSRWLSMGRGVYDTSQVDGTEAQKLGRIDPGKLLGINLGSKKIGDVLMWLQSPHDEKWFDTQRDDEDMRFVLRLPEQAMGVTDGKTTATAINTANTGSQIAASDKQLHVQLGMEEVYDDYAEILVQELRPEEVTQECGAYAVWPKVYDDRTAKKLAQQVHQQVNQLVMQQIEQQQVQGLLTGQPMQLDQQQIDQQIAELTEQLMTKQFGTPEPLSREALYRRLQVKVKVSLNANLDRQQRIQSITDLLGNLVKLGAQPGQINLEPFARLISTLMGDEDDIEPILKPDPNALIQSLAQIAETNPSSVSPQSAVVLANLGMLAQRFLAAQGANGGGPGGAAPSPSAGRAAPPAAPAPAPDPSQPQ